MLVTRACKTELDLNDQQITACEQHAGAARYAYNWGLAQKQERYKVTGKSPYAMELHRELNLLKKTDLPWMYDVSKCAPQEALRNRLERRQFILKSVIKKLVAVIAEKDKQLRSFDVCDDGLLTGRWFHRRMPG